MTATQKSQSPARRLTPAQWNALRHIAGIPRTEARRFLPATLDKLVAFGLIIRDRPGKSLPSRYTLSAKGVEVYRANSADGTS